MSIAVLTDPNLANKPNLNIYVQQVNAVNGVYSGSVSVAGTITASNLSNPTLIVDLSANGIWASPVPVVLYFSKSGKNVTVAYTAISNVASSASYVQFDSITLPAAFYPSVNYNGADSSGDIYYSIPIIDNGTSQTGMLQFSIESPPELTIYITTASGGNYSGSGASGFFAGSFTYSTD
jgi:hypothetical protein